MNRRRKFVNEISNEGLEKVRLLIRLAKEAELAAPTRVLLRAARLQGDPHTGRGALKMAEALGLIHAARGERKGLCWRGGSRASGESRDPKLPDLLPFRRLRDLLQYFRGSLIGTPDLLREVGAPNQRELLGALKALHVLGFVETGKLDPQTIAWRWVGGRGQSRTYLRGYFEREERPVSLEHGPRDDKGTVRWPWIDEIVHREWLLGEEGGFASVAENDGTRRFRPPTVVGQAVSQLVEEGIAGMTALQGAVLESTLLRGRSEEETAEALGISRSTVRRLSDGGLETLRETLTAAGFAPPAATTATTHGRETAPTAKERRAA